MVTIGTFFCAKIEKSSKNPTQLKRCVGLCSFKFYFLLFFCTTKLFFSD